MIDVTLLGQSYQIYLEHRLVCTIFVVSYRKGRTWSERVDVFLNHQSQNPYPEITREDFAECDTM